MFLSCVFFYSLQCTFKVQPSLFTVATSFHDPIKQNKSSNNVKTPTTQLNTRGWVKSIQREHKVYCTTLLVLGSLGRYLVVPTCWHPLRGKKEKKKRRVNETEHGYMYAYHVYVCCRTSRKRRGTVNSNHSERTRASPACMSTRTPN
jgi:hypothetical protein